MDIVVTHVRQVGRELILESNSVVGYQHSANLYVKLETDTSESNPFSGMVLSAYCSHWQSKMPVICPIEEKEDGLYILLNDKVFEQDGDIYLSLGGINDEKVVVTSNKLILQVDESNNIITKVSPIEKYWEIEVLNAMKAWYVNVIVPTFQESETKLNQLIRRTEEHEEKAEQLQTKAEEQQTKVDEAVKQSELATEAASTATSNANTAASEANEAAQAASTAKANADAATQSANTAASNANSAAQNANDIASEVERKLNAGEFVGAAGSKGDKGDQGDKGDTGPIGPKGEQGGLGGDTLPIGAITTVVERALPNGWLFCDGSEVSRSDYPELFGIIGTTYGEGDGSTTFKLPNEPNPLTYTKDGSSIQLSNHEPELLVIIKAKQVVPIVASVEDTLESDNPTTNAPSINQVNTALIALWLELKKRNVSNANLIINGDFRIWQRGTVVDAGKRSGYTADRWYMSRNEAVRAKTTIKQNDGLCVAFTSAPANGENVQFDYFMPPEGFKKIENETVTLSYEGSGNIKVRVRVKNGDNYTDIVAITDDSEVTFDLPVCNEGDILDIVVYAYSTATIHYVKLEQGGNATPLAPRYYSEELMECMRFYQRITYSHSTYCASLSTSMQDTLFLKMPMRTTPTITSLTNIPNNDSINVRSINYSYTPGGTVRFSVDPSATGFVRVYNATVELDAELI